MAFSWLGTNEIPEKAPERQWLHGHQGVITWTRPKLERFKEVAAVAARGTLVPISRLKETGDWSPEKNISFEFEDKTFVLGYAKYLIEYLDKRLE